MNAPLRRGLLFLPLLGWALLKYGWGFDGLYGQDAYEYVRYSTDLVEYITGQRSEVSFFWPIGFSFWGALGHLIGLSEQAVLRLVNVAALYGLFFCLFSLLQRWNPDQKASIQWFLILAVLVSPYLVRASLVIMSDISAALWVALAVWNWDAYRLGAKPRFLYQFGAFAVLACLTRYACVVPLAVLALSFCFQSPTSSAYSWKQHWGHLCFAGLLAAAVSIPVLLTFSGAAGLFDHDALGQWRVQHFFQRAFVSTDGVIKNAFPNLIYVWFPFFHPGFLFFGIFLVGIFFWNQMSVKPWFWCGLAILAYAFFLAGINYQNNRFLILGYPLVLLLLYAPFGRCWTWLKERQVHLWTVLGVLMLQVGLSARALKPQVQAHLLEQELVNLTCPAVEGTVFTFYVDGAFRYYCPELQIENLSDPATNFQTGQYCLFHPAAFGEQWAGSALMQHWETLKMDYELESIAESPSGWSLFQIREKQMND